LSFACRRAFKIATIKRLLAAVLLTSAPNCYAPDCGLPASAASVALFSLEMKRLVRQLPGKMFRRNK